MSEVAAVGDTIQKKIYFFSSDMFVRLGRFIFLEDIWHDFAQLTPQGLKATFYVKGVDNVVRKDFNREALLQQMTHPQIKTLKVKYKRPDKEVRFYIEIENENDPGTPVC